MTQNGAFTYTIQNFVDKNTREIFSSSSYNGSPLSNCAVQSMGVFANFVAFDALFEVCRKSPTAKQSLKNLESLGNYQLHPSWGP